jgi:hypothetical protein
MGEDLAERDGRGVGLGRWRGQRGCFHPTGDLVGYIGLERVAILPGDRGHQGDPGGEIGEVEELQFAGDFSPKLQRWTVTLVRRGAA